MKRSFWLLGCLLLAGGIAACDSTLTDTAPAEVVAKRYFELIKVRDFDGVLPLYSPQFFATTSKEKWLQDLRKVNERLGNLESYELVRWEIKNSLGTADRGTFYLLHYKSTYERQSAIEKITLFKPASGGDIKILSHAINWETF